MKLQFLFPAIPEIKKSGHFEHLAHIMGDLDRVYASVTTSILFFWSAAGCMITEE